VGSRDGPDAMEKKEISYSCRESNSGSPARNSSQYRLSYPGKSENIPTVRRISRKQHSKIHSLTHDRTHWWVLVKIAMALVVLHKLANLLITLTTISLSR
jgi:hypothetical protein